MINVMKKLGIDRAFIHALLIPFILVIITFFIERKVTVIVPLTYILILSCLHLFRMFTTKNKIYILRGKEFFELVGTVFLFFMLIVSIVLILSIG